MKKHLLLFALLWLISGTMFAQDGISINASVSHKGSETANGGIAFTHSYSENNGAYENHFVVLDSPRVTVVAEYYPDPFNPNSPYVKVSWQGYGSYKVYRSDCYDTNPTMIAQNITTGEYIDSNWTNLEPGTYMYGVRINTEAISWSNCLEKEMFSEMVSITVQTGDGNSPSGTTVNLLNHNSVEQVLYPVAPITLDETGYYMWNVFRNGNYQITITKSGYETIVDEVEIWEDYYSMSYTLIPSNAYHITVSANPIAGGTVLGDGYYQQGQQCTVSASANSGYVFTNWTENGNVVSTNASYTFTVNGNRTLMANFALQNYTINATADPTTGGTVTGGGTFNYGQTCTLTATANEGYIFANWTKQGQQVSTNATYTFSVTESATYVAHFEIEMFTITTIANPEEGGIVTGSGTYEFGEVVTVTATPNEGYNFVNWTKNDYVVSTESIHEFIVTEDATYVANFDFGMPMIEISAAVDPEEAASITGAGTYSYGDTVTLTFYQNEGWTFVKWTECGEVVSEDTIYTFIATMSRSLVANFVFQNIYTITVLANPEEGGSVTGDGQYYEGTNCFLEATPSPGYQFDNWTRNGTVVSTDRVYSFEVSENETYIANFADENACIIYVDIVPEEAGTATGTGVYYPGNTCTLKASPKPGYSFQKWTKDNETVSENPDYTFEVTETSHYTAHFYRIGYVISANASPADGGNVTGSGIYAQGLTITLSATANDGYEFMNWTENGIIQCLTAQYEFVVNRDRTLTANFNSLPVYTISATAGPDGSIDPQGDVQVVKGSDVTFTIKPDFGFRIMSVLVDNNNIGQVDTYTFANVNNNHTISVSFNGWDIEENNTTEIKVYPNPAKEKVFVEGDDLAVVSLYDLLGNCMRRTDCETSHEMSLSGVISGAYILMIKTNDGHIRYQKLMVTR